ncbi:uncharacterized protein NPIL_147111 [Nephila pilipes]|uniref:Uncharacterized protein n=1 Tax=Nephila pilipes TaxID=299642 RepID=A0A8X6UMG2_NEPPI|nr:uncharacterized protein NPIL_147111 [Nephila pilipes]
MDAEESYNALYLYNAVIEYIYFVISLIQDEGSKSLNNVEKYVELFNHDIYSFAEKFKGKDLAEKVGNMLCVATPAFNTKDEILNLSGNYEYFKRSIYRDILLNKVIDLILRGTSSIKNICHNLNQNNLINIEEESLKIILKKCPYFYVDNDSSVIVVQFHGFFGFEDNAYKTIVQYFQSYLQNSMLTYDEIKFHTKFVPSCAVPNLLLIFCVFHVCSIFKCDKNKVYLRKKFKRKKHAKQIIDIDGLGIKLSDSIPVALLVYKAFGQKLHGWTGEITHLTKHTGLIQCVVNFTNNYQGIFKIYFYKTSLKYLCEIESVEDYLSIRDVVEFDAEFCEEDIEQGIFWQATFIKVTKHFFKNNKFEISINTEMYMEKIILNIGTFKLSCKTCSSRNCQANYSVLEKDVKKNNKIMQTECNFIHSLNFDSKDFTESCNVQIKSSSQKISLPSQNASVANDNLPLSICDFDQNSVIDAVINSKCNGNSEVNINKKEASKIFNLDNNSKLLEVDIESTLSSDLIKSVVLSPSDESKKDLDCVESICKTEYSEKKYSSKDGIFVPNLLFLHSAFMFGKIEIISQEEGVAITLHTCPLYEVFFKCESTFLEYDKVPNRDSIVLLFIPYFKAPNTVLVATLVYPLKSEDAISALEQKLSVEDFVVKKFYSVVKNYLVDINSCNCDLSSTLLFKTLVTQNVEKEKEIFEKCSNCIKNLQEIFCFTEKTRIRFLATISLLYHQNSDMSSQKLSIYLTRLLMQVFSLTLCSRKASMLSKKKKNLKAKINFKRRRHYNYSFSNDLAKSVPNNGKNVIATKEETTEVKSHIQEKILAKNIDSVISKKSNEFLCDSVIKSGKTFLDTGSESCTSLSSYKSCNSKGSDDAFYSCESLSDAFESDLEANESTIFIYRSRNANICGKTDFKDCPVNISVTLCDLHSPEEKSDVHQGTNNSEISECNINEEYIEAILKKKYLVAKEMFCVNTTRNGQKNLSLFE